MYNKFSPVYSRIPVLENDMEYEEEKADLLSSTTRPSKLQFSRSVAYATGCWLLGLACGYIFYGIFSRTPADISFGPQLRPGCREPVTRHEWRSLSATEKTAYINAVQCLRQLPSRTGVNHSLYDDFPWTHQGIGFNTHDAADFLPWHRYYIHVYEAALKGECGYNGSLTYWDWSLDWENIAKAPIFDPVSGFGGNGNITGAVTVGEGRCVTDGPFAGMEALYYGPNTTSHCFSRGFLEDAHRYDVLCASEMKPSRLDAILAIEDYETFFATLENGPHRAIPYAVGGEFRKFTAPYDPVFFLHHTQLDRLWWKWQNQNRGKRLSEYHGPSAKSSSGGVLLQDHMEFGPLAPSVSVAEVMDTQSGLFCYNY